MMQFDIAPEFFDIVKVINFYMRSNQPCSANLGMLVVIIMPLACARVMHAYTELIREAGHKALPHCAAYRFYI